MNSLSPQISRISKNYYIQHFQGELLAKLAKKYYVLIFFTWLRIGNSANKNSIYILSNQGAQKNIYVVLKIKIFSKIAKILLNFPPFQSF